MILIFLSNFKKITYSYLANPTEDYTYNLKALSIHMGSLNSGHYVTAAKR
jgi:hypothetical protein